DVHLTPAEVDAARSTLKDKILARIEVTSGGASCTPKITDAGLTEQEGLLLTGRSHCASADKPFDVALPLLDDLARGHRHVARTIGGAGTHDEVLYGEQRSFTLSPEG